MPDLVLVSVVAIVLLAVVFDFSNGFHDAANSIATVVSTRVLSPRVAVIWAAAFNFLAFLIFKSHVANTVGKIVDPAVVSEAVVFAGWSAINAASLQKTVLFIVLSPLFGMVLGFLIMLANLWAFRRATPRRVGGLFRRLQLVSAAAFSLGHGGNDAQKTMGIISALLVGAGYLHLEPNGNLPIPFWIVLLAYGAIALGTLSGGWRIIKTLGQRITALKPIGGFSAETAAATSLYLATFLGVPVSTTHTITGAIVGVGATRRLSAVRWGVARRIVWAWVATIPAAGLVAAATFWVVTAYHLLAILVAAAVVVAFATFGRRLWRSPAGAEGR
jgi:PiT family inorganic phosphate transporter